MLKLIDNKHIAYFFSNNFWKLVGVKDFTRFYRTLTRRFLTNNSIFFGDDDWKSYECQTAVNLRKLFSRGFLFNSRAGVKTTSGLVDYFVIKQRRMWYSTFGVSWVSLIGEDRVSNFSKINLNTGFFLKPLFNFRSLSESEQIFSSFSGDSVGGARLQCAMEATSLRIQDSSCVDLQLHLKKSLQLAAYFALSCKYFPDLRFLERCYPYDTTLLRANSVLVSHVGVNFLRQNQINYLCFGGMSVREFSVFFNNFVPINFFFLKFTSRFFNDYKLVALGGTVCAAGDVRGSRGLPIKEDSDFAEDTASFIILPATVKVFKFNKTLGKIWSTQNPKAAWERWLLRKRRNRWLLQNPEVLKVKDVFFDFNEHRGVITLRRKLFTFTVKNITLFRTFKLILKNLLLLLLRFKAFSNLVGRPLVRSRLALSEYLMDLYQKLIYRLPRGVSSYNWAVSVNTLADSGRAQINFVSSSCNRRGDMFFNVDLRVESFNFFVKNSFCPAHLIFFKSVSLFFEYVCRAVVVFVRMLLTTNLLDRAGHFTWRKTLTLNQSFSYFYSKMDFSVPNYNALVFDRKRSIFTYISLSYIALFKYLSPLVDNPGTKLMFFLRRYLVRDFFLYNSGLRVFFQSSGNFFFTPSAVISADTALKRVVCSPTTPLAVLDLHNYGNSSDCLRLNYEKALFDPNSLSWVVLGLGLPHAEFFSFLSVETLFYSRYYFSRVSPIFTGQPTTFPDTLDFAHYLTYIPQFDDELFDKFSECLLKPSSSALYHGACFGDGVAGLSSLRFNTLTFFDLPDAHLSYFFNELDSFSPLFEEHVCRNSFLSDSVITCADSMTIHRKLTVGSVFTLKKNVNFFWVQHYFYELSLSLIYTF